METQGFGVPGDVLGKSVPLRWPWKNNDAPENRKWCQAASGQRAERIYDLDRLKVMDDTAVSSPQWVSGVNEHSSPQSRQTLLLLLFLLLLLSF